MIKKLKNKKGFAMAELLAVSMVVLILFSVLFSNYLPLVAEYENRFSYNDVTAQYAAYYVSKIYDDNMYKTSDGTLNVLQQIVVSKTDNGGYYTVYNENAASNEIYTESYFKSGDAQKKYNEKIIKEYKIKEIIITTFKLEKLKNKLGNDSNGGYPKSGVLYNYIKYLPKYENAILEKDKETYRVIIKTDYGYATTSIKTSTCKGNTIGEYKKAEGSLENIANSPVLDDNMIPVYYDTCVGEWKKADVKNEVDGYRWYNYDEKVWANSVTVSSTSRSTYKNAEAGTIIPMDDILTMQVWIPRYKYKVWNYNADGTAKSEPQEIEITWENGTSKTGEIECQDAISGTLSENCSLVSNNKKCEVIAGSGSGCDGKTYMHPAFTFGDNELTGFWIGKFELTGNIDNITTKPDVKSLTNQKVTLFASSITKMKSFSTDTDTHMIKNMEWGAVAYLSHSKYGTCTDGECREVYINNSESHYTGRSGGNVAGSTSINGTYTNQSAITQYNTFGFYTYDGYLLSYNTNKKSITRDLSKVASTTGNIYGVYDMSGGSREYTMANIVSFDGFTMISGLNPNKNSGYKGILSNGETYASDFVYPVAYYYDIYRYRQRGETIKTGKLGDATKEMLKKISAKKYGWHNDIIELADNEAPWFFRGGNSKVDEISTNSDLPTTIGIFASGYFTGEANDTYSTRVIIVPKGKEN